MPEWMKTWVKLDKVGQNCHRWPKVVQNHPKRSKLQRGQSQSGNAGLLERKFQAPGWCTPFQGVCAIGAVRIQLLPGECCRLLFKSVDPGGRGRGGGEEGPGPEARMLVLARSAEFFLGEMPSDSPDFRGGLLPLGGPPGVLKSFALVLHFAFFFTFVLPHPCFLFSKPRDESLLSSEAQHILCFVIMSHHVPSFVQTVLFFSLV